MTLDLADKLFRRVRIFEMAKLWQRSSDPKTKLPLAEVDLHNLHLSRPSVIFLSGIFTTDKNHTAIAEGIAEIENLLKDRTALKSQPDIYALSHKDLGNIFNVAAYNGNPGKAHSKSAKRMAEALILPLVLSKKGKPLDVATAKANLRNITFVAYSAGTVFAQEMYNASLKQMGKAGYRRKDAKEILNEVVLISMAAVSRPLEEKERFTTVYLAASNDIAVRLKNRIWRPLQDLFSLDSRDLKIRALSQSSLLVTAPISKNMWHWLDQPDGSRIRQEIAPLMPKRLRIASNHEMPHYTTRDDEHNAFSRLVLNTVVNAVNRSGKAEVLDLLSPVTARDAADAEAYNARIREALDRGSLRDQFDAATGQAEKKDAPKKKAKNNNDKKPKSPKPQNGKAA